MVDRGHEQHNLSHTLLKRSAGGCVTGVKVKKWGVQSPPLPVRPAPPSPGGRGSPAEQRSTQVRALIRAHSSLPSNANTVPIISPPQYTDRHARAPPLHRRSRPCATQILSLLLHPRALPAQHAHLETEGLMGLEGHRDGCQGGKKEEGGAHFGAWMLTGHLMCYCGRWWCSSSPHPVSAPDARARFFAQALHPQARTRCAALL